MKKLLILSLLLCSALFGQTPSDVPNATVTAKGCPVIIQLRYADAPSIAMLFSNSKCQGIPLRYSQLMMMSGGGGYGQQNRYGQGNGQGNQGFGGWQQGGQGGNQGFGGQGRVRGNNGGW